MLKGIGGKHILFLFLLFSTTIYSFSPPPTLNYTYRQIDENFLINSIRTDTIADSFDKGMEKNQPMIIYLPRNYETISFIAFIAFELRQNGYDKQAELLESFLNQVSIAANIDYLNNAINTLEDENIQPSIKEKSKQIKKILSKKSFLQKKYRKINLDETRTGIDLISAMFHLDFQKAMEIAIDSFMLIPRKWGDREKYIWTWISFYNDIHYQIKNSTTEMNEYAKNAYLALYKVEMAGICDEEGCEQMNDYEILKSKLENASNTIFLFSINANYPSANFSYFDDVMNLYYGEGGIKELSKRIIDKSEAQMETWLSKYINNKKELKKSKEKYLSLLDKVTYHRLDLINQSNTSNILTSSSYPISEYISLAAELGMNASSSEKEADTFYKEGEKGYLVNAVEKLDEARGNYEAATNFLSLALSSAKNVVDELFNKVELQTKTIDKDRLSKEGKDEFNYFNTLFKHCKHSDALGKRYTCLKEAELLLNEIKGKTINSTESIHQEIILKELEDLIDKAEEDGLDVNKEKVYLTYLKQSHQEGSLATSNLINWAELIRGSIVEKARIRYSFIPLKRIKLLSLLHQCDYACSDLTEQLQEEERGCFLSNGSLLYENCIGRLHILEELYTNNIQPVRKRIDELFSKLLFVKAEMYESIAYLDKNSTCKIKVIIHNPTNITKIMPSVDLPIEYDERLTRQDIVDGKEYVKAVLNQNAKKTLILNNISAYQTISIHFLVRRVLARTVKQENEIFGSSMLGLFKKTKLTVEFSNDASALFISFSSNPINMTVDGFPVELNSTQINFPFSKGRHTLSYIVKIPDQTRIELKNKTEMKDTAYKTFVREYFEISSPVALKSYSFYLPIILYDAENVVVYSTTGHTIKHKLEFGRVWINIKNLAPNVPAEIQISYEINNISSYLTDQIEILKQKNLTEEEKNKLNEINMMVENKDYANALKEIHKFQKEIEERKRKEVETKTKIERKVSELNDWQKEIENAFNKTTSKELKTILGSENEKIKDVLNKASYATSDEALEILESYSSKSFTQTVNKKRKEMEKENEELKEWFVDNEINNDSVWEMFDKIDGLLIQHEINPNNLNALVEAEEEISRLKNIKDEMEEKIKNEKSKLIKELNTILSSIEPLKQSYVKALKSAKGTPYSKYFDISEREMDKIIGKGEKLKANMNVAHIKKIKETVQELTELRASINRTLNGLEELFTTRLKQVRQNFEDKKSFLSPDQIKSIEEKIEKSEEMMEEGKIIDAHLYLDKLESQISHLAEEQHNSNYVLLVSGILLLVAIIYYLKDSKMLDGVLRKEEKKKKPILRRLKKIGDG